MLRPLLELNAANEPVADSEFAALNSMLMDLAGKLGAVMDSCIIAARVILAYLSPGRLIEISLL